jgi:hypothetical protein
MAKAQRLKLHRYGVDSIASVALVLSYNQHSLSQDFTGRLPHSLQHRQDLLLYSRTTTQLSQTCTSSIFLSLTHVHFIPEFTNSDLTVSNAEADSPSQQTSIDI